MSAAATLIPPRPVVLELSPYIPGRSIAEVERELRLKNVVKLASNENPYGPSPKAAAAYRKAVRSLHLYPEGPSPLLRRSLERRLGLPDGSVIVGNGSDEIIRLLCEAFLDTGDEVVVSQYAFLRFRQQARLMNAEVVEAPAAGWGHDLGAMARAVTSRTKLIFVANPNNPTGTYNSADEVADFLEALPTSVLAVFDEAYEPYARARADFPRSLPRFIGEHPNAVVLRTFSKVHGLAGLRVGYGAASPEIVGCLDRIRMPFNVSLPAQHACLAALQDVSYVRQTLKKTLAERESLAKALRGLGLRVGESATNFLFVELPRPGREIFERLLALGVIIRPLDEYGLGRHARISVGDASGNRRLLKAMSSILK